MRSLLIGILCLCTTLPMAQGKQLQELHDGAKIDMTGTIRVVRRGNHAFIMLKTSSPYVAVYDYGNGSVERRHVSEIGLMEDEQNDELKKYAGQKVTVSGKLMIEFVSPYYFNGTLIDAASVHLQSGKILLPVKTTTPPLPVSLNQYRAEVTFTPANRKQYSAKAWDMQGKLLDTDKNYLSCNLSSAGDVMNCFCADGFKPTDIGRLRTGIFISTLHNQDSIFDDMSMAQFGLPEELKESISRVIECMREQPKTQNPNGKTQ